MHGSDKSCRIRDLLNLESRAHFLSPQDVPCSQCRRPAAMSPFPLYFTNIYHALTVDLTLGWVLSTP